MKAHELLTSYGADVEALAKDRSVFHPYQFMNDASYSQNPLESYGAENGEIMRLVSLVYDPSGVFQALQNNGFLLSKMLQVV
jgi:hypothetical protein